MAFIAYEPPGTIDPKLAELNDQIRRAGKGIVPNILRIQSHSPAALEAHLGIYKTLMFARSELSRIRREMIAVVVSQINQCHY